VRAAARDARKVIKVAYDIIHNSRRALLDLLNKAPATRMNARLFLTAEKRRPQTTPSPLLTDHATMRLIRR
jgi:isocitrate/isopropylmalate dehydrogenase